MEPVRTSADTPWAWTMARYVAIAAGAFCIASALGAAVGGESLVWSAMLLASAGGMGLGLFVLGDRPGWATVALCAGSLLAGLSFFWFPPAWLVMILVWAGSLTTLSQRRAAV
jgi:hypothetical protein